MKKILLALAIAATMLLANTTIPVMADEPVTPDEIVTSFLAHLETLEQLDDATRAEIRSALDRETADEYTRIEALTSGLARIYPEYGKALLATQADDLEEAVAGLRPLVDAEDRFLAADSSFFLARMLMNEEKHEEAIRLLDRLAEDLAPYTLHAGPSLYFSGVAQSSLLENQRALQSFAAFLEGYPAAPERLRVAAWRQIQVIQAIEEGGMEDILQRMDYSHRRLKIEETDETTQGEQQRIVTMLQKMIAEEEKKECSSCSSKKNCEGQQESQGQQEGQQNGQGKSTAGGTSNNPNGVVRRTFDDGPASPWSRLRERSRDAANNAIKQKLPARYRNVVEKYYETISGNEETRN